MDSSVVLRSKNKDSVAHFGFVRMERVKNLFSVESFHLLEVDSGSPFFARFPEFATPGRVPVIRPVLARKRALRFKLPTRLLQGLLECSSGDWRISSIALHRSSASDRSRQLIASKNARADSWANSVASRSASKLVPLQNTLPHLLLDILITQPQGA